MYSATLRPKMLMVPLANAQNSLIQIEIPAHLIIVGANGAGKSRFAAAIENYLKDTGQNVTRISAQRSVSIPNEIRLRSLQDAIKENSGGSPYWVEQNGGFGRASRTDREQNLLRVLSDFDTVLGLIFARTSKVYQDYYKQEGEKSITPLQQLNLSWTSLLPERELIFNEEKMSIDVRIKATGDQFHTSRMSDGERTILYLLCQCLSVEPGSVIIIDEPELHMHRSVINSLFSNLQLDRPDCLFIYVTHDLEFASGQPNSTKIWLKSYLNSSWNWTLVPENEILPERLFLEVLGTRKPVLFIEGENRSDDREVYDILFPKMNVIPCGSCDQVIKAVAVLRQNNNLTHMSAYGLIDRDFRSTDEIDKLSQKGVYFLEVAEVENLFAVEEVIDILASEFSSGDDRKFKAKETIRINFSEQLSRQISNSAVFTVRSKLDGIGQTPNDGKEYFQENFSNHIASINTSEIYDDIQRRFTLAKTNGEIKEILKIFNMKKLRYKVGKELGIQPDVFYEKTMTMLKDDKSALMKNAFKKYMPAQLNQFMSDSTNS